MEIEKEIKSYLFCSILESAMARSEMEVLLRCENYIQVDALTVVDFTRLYVAWLSFHCWCQSRRLLLSSHVSLLVINLLTIKERVREKRQWMKLI